MVSGIVKRERDELDSNAPPLLEAAPISLVSVEMAVATTADQSAERTLTPPQGWIRTFKGSFTTTTDGRLIKATAESTGEGATIASSIAGLVGTAVGFAALGDETGDNAEEAAFGKLVGAEPYELDAYREAHQPELERGASLAAAQASVRSQLASELGRVAENPSAGLQGVDRLRSLARGLRSELAPLVTHYATWRASKKKSVQDTFSFRVDLNLIPTELPPADWAAPASADPSAGLPSTLQELWERFGVGIEATWYRQRPAGQADVRSSVNPTVAPGENEIVIRRPDVVDLRVVEHKNDVPVTTARSTHTVVDARSEHEVLELKKSWFGRRSLDLSFDAEGLPIGIGFEGASAVSAALAGAAGLPAAFSTGVEAATTASANLRTARRASAEAELARVKGAVELRQQKLLALGLDATEGDAVRLTRLTQLKDILEAQGAIAEADPSLVATVQGLAGNDLDWYEEPPPAPPAPNQVIEVVLRDGPPDAPEPPLG